MLPTAGLRLMIVDDDALSREVVAVLAADAGFSVEAHETGDAALHALTSSAPLPPDIILVDLHMPGLCGEPLARLLRAASGPNTVLLAMSGSSISCDVIRSFDAFLLKPFSMNEIWSALDRSSPSAGAPNSPAEQYSLETILNMTTYSSLAELMAPDQLRGLYAMCLDDANARVESLRQASMARDPDAWTNAAHSLKGGCGMVGASELACIAAEMERTGLPPVDNIAPFEEFLAASSRLRRMLDAQN